MIDHIDGPHQKLIDHITPHPGFQVGKAWEEVVKLRASDAQARRAILEDPPLSPRHSFRI